MKTETIPFTGENWKLLKPPSDCCQECAVKHEPSQPHNQQSLHYQYQFYLREQRWPTWEDAMAHCSEDVKEQWKQGLREHGVKI